MGICQIGQPGANLEDSCGAGRRAVTKLRPKAESSAPTSVVDRVGGPSSDAVGNSQHQPDVDSPCLIVNNPPRILVSYKPTRDPFNPKICLRAAGPSGSPLALRLRRSSVWMVGILAHTMALLHSTGPVAIGRAVTPQRWWG
ncbi:unnamed protein product [Protopolystoma xenopodis]|uniref:Uncharacterized protein n=1 Tax=Protopolystoma xenopodis TaxID=117903 RepID=A0A3S5ABF1_9PLAT|nr:unnamed protein product [Protopolystoma xenopodis]